MPHVAMKHESDPRLNLINKLGDISGITLFRNQVLVAIYMRGETSETTVGGIILPASNLSEDKHQGKVGLVIALGPDAFKPSEDGRWQFNGVNVKEHDWIWFRPSDAWSITVNKIDCRIVDDTEVRGALLDPDSVW